jgi:hypothetical protein
MWVIVVRVRYLLLSLSMANRALKNINLRLLGYLLLYVLAT